MSNEMIKNHDEIKRNGQGKREIKLLQKIKFITGKDETNKM